jgi:hypothetical protein
MVTDTEPGASSSAPTTAGDDCPDPTDKHLKLQQLSAEDCAKCDRRKLAVEEMDAQVGAVVGLQLAYENALVEQRAALLQLLEELKAIRKTVECDVPGDRRKTLVDCFCERVKSDHDEPAAQPMPKDPCPKAKDAQLGDLEDLRRTQTLITRAIEEHKKALKERTDTPGAVKAKVGALAALVKDLNKQLCEKTIDAERAFVMHLQYRREYVELRRLLTDSRSFVCRIYQLIDELFALFEFDVCVAGAIARLEKEEALKQEQKKDAGAFIDDVLRCAKPEDPSKPPDDDCDDVDDLDPCRCADSDEPKPTEPSGKPEPDPCEGEKGETPTPPTEQHPPPTEQQPPPTQQQPPPTEQHPPSPGAAA